MKEYKRLDPNRPLTESEVFMQTDKFFKRSKVVKLLKEASQEFPQLSERAIFMKKEITFYHKGIVVWMTGMCPEYKEARKAFLIEEKKNSNEQKLIRAIFGEQKT